MAHSNPNLAHPFVRSHAKNASKILIIGAILWGLFLFAFSSSLAQFHIPIIALSLAKCGNMVISISIITMLFRGAYQALQGLMTKEVTTESIFTQEENNHLSQIDLPTEQSRTLTLLSYIPFVSAALFDRRDIREIIRTGYIISSYFITIFLILLLSSSVSSAAVILGFFYCAFASYMVIHAFFLHKQSFNEIITKIPTRQEIELIFLSLIPYIRSSIQEHTSPVSLRQITTNIYQQYTETSKSYLEQFPKISTHILIPLLHIPVISIIAAMVTKHRKMRLYRSLFASSVIGVLTILFWYFGLRGFLALSVSYLIIMSLRSHLNNDVTSEVCESFRLFLSRVLFHAGTQKTRIQAKMEQTEEVVFMKKEQK
ncbi:MAG: hypothetical protein U0518_06105 [Candidatus Gracilibacteria bacterium]